MSRNQGAASLFRSADTGAWTWQPAANVISATPTLANQAVPTIRNALIVGSRAGRTNGLCGVNTIPFPSSTSAVQHPSISFPLGGIESCLYFFSVPRDFQHHRAVRGHGHFQAGSVGPVVA